MKKQENDNKQLQNEPAYMKTDGQINTDPFGSFTGNPTDDDTPVQDADDL